MRWQITSYRPNRLSIHTSSPRNYIQVMFVCEVEEEYVVGLAVDGFLYGIRLVSYERGEYAIVPHAGNDVVPVGFS